MCSFPQWILDIYWFYFLFIGSQQQSREQTEVFRHSMALAHQLKHGKRQTTLKKIPHSYWYSQTWRVDTCAHACPLNIYYGICPILFRTLSVWIIRVGTESERTVQWCTNQWNGIYERQCSGACMRKIWINCRVIWPCCEFWPFKLGSFCWELN